MSLIAQITDSFKEANNCITPVSTSFEVIEIKGKNSKSPCEISPNGHFKIINSKGILLYFLQIDYCLLDDQNSQCPEDNEGKRPTKKCDFAVFNETKLVFVELKQLESNKHPTRRGHRRKAYEQLCDTLECFKRKGLNLKDYEIFAVISLLESSSPTNRLPAGTLPKTLTQNQPGQRKKSIEIKKKYNATLLYKPEKSGDNQKGEFSFDD